MTARSGRRASGFTMLEVVVGVALLLGGVSVFGAVMGSTERMTKDSQIHTHVTRDHRRNLNGIANQLSMASIDSLRGFDGKGIATQCTFRRVVAQDESGPVYGPDEVIAWVPSDLHGLVDGRPTGRVVLFSPSGAKSLLADRVPQGTFAVRQEGRNLVIRLTTLYRTTEQRIVQMTSETAVMLRN